MAKEAGKLLFRDGRSGLVLVGLASPRGLTVQCFPQEYFSPTPPFHFRCVGPYPGSRLGRAKKNCKSSTWTMPSALIPPLGCLFSFSLFSLRVELYKTSQCRASLMQLMQPPPDPLPFCRWHIIRRMALRHDLARASLPRPGGAATDV